MDVAGFVARFSVSGHKSGHRVRIALAKRGKFDDPDSIRTSEQKPRACARLVSCAERRQLD